MLDLIRWTDGWGDEDLGAIIDVAYDCLAMFGLLLDAY